MSIEVIKRNKEAIFQPRIIEFFLPNNGFSIKYIAIAPEINSPTLLIRTEDV